MGPVRRNAGEIAAIAVLAACFAIPFLTQDPFVYSVANQVFIAVTGRLQRLPDAEDGPPDLRGPGLHGGRRLHDGDRRPEGGHHRYDPADGDELRRASRAGAAARDPRAAPARRLLRARHLRADRDHAARPVRDAHLDRRLERACRHAADHALRGGARRQPGRAAARHRCRARGRDHHGARHRHLPAAFRRDRGERDAGPEPRARGVALQGARLRGGGRACRHGRRFARQHAADRPPDLVQPRLVGQLHRLHDRGRAGLPARADRRLDIARLDVEPVQQPGPVFARLVRSPHRRRGAGGARRHRGHARRPDPRRNAVRPAATGPSRPGGRTRPEARRERLGHRGRSPGRRVAGRADVEAFGGLQVFSDLSFTLEPGQILGVIGPNGAGKTTLINVICGKLAPSAGSISLGGQPIGGRSFHTLARMGLIRSFQQTNTFKSATVRENLSRAVRFSGSPPSIWERLDTLLRQFDLAPRLDEPSDKLPYGLQKMLGLLLAYATRPGVLLLDEPAAGLERRERSQVDAFVEAARQDHGCSVLVVEHDMALIRRLCPRILVLDAGHLLAEGAPDEVLSRKDVIDAYMGVSDDDEMAA